MLRLENAVAMCGSGLSVKHGTVRVVHYDEISAGGPGSERETGSPALSYPNTKADDGNRRGTLWRSSVTGRQQGIWRCALYLRLSREDEGSDLESNSIGNQRTLLMEYIADRPELCLSGEWVDDGYSGSSFERPALQQMLQAAREGKLDCILVKDLSRFGREYIQTGWYLKKWFPQWGIRFIAVADHYDSANALFGEKALLLPILNLMNDAYCRDISRKVKNSQEARRRQGDYVGAFAPYGYQKAITNKHKLVIDKQTADVVRKIFYWKSAGYSAEKICAFLNVLLIPSPYVYKKISGQSYVSGFVDRRKRNSLSYMSNNMDTKETSGLSNVFDNMDAKETSSLSYVSDNVDTDIEKDASALSDNADTQKVCLWSPVAVRRILKNQLYIGILQQGKTRKINYKLSQRCQVPPEEWISIEKAVPPLIEESLFWKCQNR